MLIDLSAWAALCYLSFPVAAISHTIAKSRIGLPLRKWGASKSEPLGQALGCPWCLSHWIAAFLVGLYQPVVIHLLWPIDWAISGFAIVAMAAIVEGIISLLKAIMAG